MPMVFRKDGGKKRKKTKKRSSADCTDFTDKPPGICVNRRNLRTNPLDCLRPPASTWLPPVPPPAAFSMLSPYFVPLLLRQDNDLARVHDLRLARSFSREMNSAWPASIFCFLCSRISRCQSGDSISGCSCTSESQRASIAARRSARLMFLISRVSIRVPFSYPVWDRAVDSLDHRDDSRGLGVGSRGPPRNWAVDSECWNRGIWEQWGCSKPLPQHSIIPIFQYSNSSHPWGLSLVTYHLSPRPPPPPCLFATKRILNI